jgi:phosphate transport system permease protein
MSEPLQQETDAASARRIARRNRAEVRFRTYGLAAIGLALAILVILFGSIVYRGLGAFTHSVVELEITLDPDRIDPDGTRSQESLARGDYAALVRTSLRSLFPEVTGRKPKRELDRLLSNGAAYDLQSSIIANPSSIGETLPFEVPLSDEADLQLQGEPNTLSEAQAEWLEALRKRDIIHTRFNWGFLLSGDSREPELAGIGGALVGSLLTMFVAFALCFPLGVATAVYLEEFAPRNRWTDLVEININNLAAVPSVIFGVLGLAIFLGLLGLPRSVPLVGGLVLGVRTLPIIIISARAALGAVPPSIREAAMAVGASPLQVVGHHVLPAASPGILTGAIIGMAQALGETAPLLMIGMVAFVVDVPTGFESPSTVLPVQIFLWSDSPERAFLEKTAGGIMVLLGFLISMNAVAVWLRQRYETRS